ncbi:MAG: glutamate/tyrosine decarboxylase-like PLP-dependent enzyme [Paracoccaceae bacterium]|jgi:glutamate/tyrosine decarboxylase-like PLP-dependent enzyme
MEEFIKSVLAKASQLKDQKVSQPTSSEKIRSEFDLGLSEYGLEKQADLHKFIDGIFAYSVNTQNPRFLNQLYGGTREITWLGDLITSILNTSMATYEIAPLATLMEKELIRIINEEIGFPQIDGLMVPGGSNANMMALHCARFAKNANIKEDGLYGIPEFHVYYSGSAHYSTQKAMSQLGMGTGQLIKVADDHDHRISLPHLQEAIKNSLSTGAIPLCVVSTAGTTVWGSFDPIDEIQDLCERHQLWHHVDAAWGGLALWSDRKESLFRGVDRVDSITMDFHKLMGASLTKAFFLTRHPEAMYGANSGGGEEYIFHSSHASRNLDTGSYALQCGRKVDSLSLWLQWKLEGTSRYRQKITELYELQNWCVDYLESHSGRFKLLHSPDYMNICFQVCPKDPEVDAGEFNRSLREEVMAQGDFMINFSSSEEHGAFFRLVLNQWGVDQAILKELFEYLEDLAKH